MSKLDFLIILMFLLPACASHETFQDWNSCLSTANTPFARLDC